MLASDNVCAAVYLHPRSEKIICLSRLGLASCVQTGEGNCFSSACWPIVDSYFRYAMYHHLIMKYL